MKWYAMNVMYACTVECRQRLPPYACVNLAGEVCLICRCLHKGLPHAQWPTKDRPLLLIAKHHHGHQHIPDQQHSEDIA